MRVASSQVSYEAAHRLATASVVREDRISTGRGRPEHAGRHHGRDSVELSPGARVSLAAGQRDDLEGLDPKQRIAALTIESVAGRRLDWRNRVAEAQSGQPARAEGRQPAREQEITRRTEFYAESEQLSFRARGTVELEDGRSIEFSVSLDLSREFYSYSSTTGSGKAQDPLVVNYDGEPARIDSGKVAFDLNSDGNLEEIPFVAGGSGFLAFDANEDGKVNDGRELFGPSTGDGFSELAKLDSDGNGWIDEGDEAFSRLGVWSREGFSSLSELGIGAISVSSIETPFSYKDEQNNLQAQLRRTGVFLTEDGGVGTVQQIDLVV